MAGRNKLKTQAMKNFENKLIRIEKSNKELVDKPGQEQYLTVGDVMKMLNVSRTLLWMWDKEGILKPTHIGKRLVRYRLSDIKNLMSDK